MVSKPDEAELAKMGVRQWPVWEAEPSSFPWHYDSTEVCYLLQGKVTVKAGDEEVVFGAGDMVVFPAGLDCFWTVHQSVRKHYSFR